MATLEDLGAVARLPQPRRYAFAAGMACGADHDDQKVPQGATGRRRFDAA